MPVFRLYSRRNGRRLSALNAKEPAGVRIKMQRYPSEQAGSMVYCPCCAGQQETAAQGLPHGGTMKIACLFPGIGYTCDKPLLYYSRKLFASLGWEVVSVPYGGFPPGVKGNAKKMKKCAEMALEQAEDLLKGIDWPRYDSILFVSKSVGTVVAGAYAARHHVSCRHVLFTPVEDTFSHGVKDAVVFHGTADPWADSGAIRKACRDAGLPLYITENANHSLETGDLETDLDTVKDAMRIVREYALRVPGGR